MVWAIGPSVERSIHEGIGLRPTIPFVGFSPTRPHSAAGILIEPPPSVDVAAAAKPAASAALDPPLEPPGDQLDPHGFRVEPNKRFEVYASKANSGAFVFPTTIAPAARSRPGTRPSWVAGGAEENSSEPCVVTNPATSSMSLTRIGTPSRGLTCSPRAILASHTEASSKARSAQVRTTALICALPASILRRDASTNSRAEMSLR